MNPQTSFFRFVPFLGAAIVMSLSSAFGAPTNAPAAKPPHPAATPAADTSDIAATVAKIPGAQLVKTKDVVTGITVSDCKALTPADYQAIRKLESLKSLQFAHGPDDASMKILAGMPAVETFTTNGSGWSDDTLATLATFKSLHTLTFFHPGKVLTGTGLTALATLPNLTSFSLGGSDVFSDAGAAALSKLPHIAEIRLWHCAVTNAGIKSLADLKELKSLSFGQKIQMKPPGTLNDDTVAIVAGIPSLESLSLSESRLSLAALSKLKQLPNLKRLTLKDTDVTASDLAALKQELPKVQIEWTAPSDTGKKRIDGIFGAVGAPDAPAAPPPPPAKK